MFWTTGLVVLALTLSQVSAELAKPVYIEDALKQEQASPPSNRIVSGWEAVPGQLPYQVSLRMVDAAGGVGGCGGSVVHRYWAISAAHCTAGRVTVVVRAGIVNLSKPEYIFETTEWYNHPTFDDNRPAVVQPNDITVVKLQRPVTYSDLLKPIRIQNSVEAFSNYDQQILIASGWGRTWTDGAQPETLNWVYLRGISNSACAQVYGTSLINNAAICAQWYNVTSQSICQGDSGGPLAATGADGEPVLVGISSFVAGGQWGCHSGLPAGFIRPGPFLSWLYDITGINFEDFEEEEDVTEVPITTVPPISTTPDVPISTTEEPITTPEIQYTTTLAPITSTDASTTEPAPQPEPEEEEEEEEEDSDEDDSDEEDEEISELLRKLVVKVKVKISINNKPRRKVKVKCVEKL